MNRYMLIVYLGIIFSVGLYGEEKSLQEIIDESFTTMPSGKSKGDVNDLIMKQFNYGNLTSEPRKTQKPLVNLIGFDMSVDEDAYILGTGDGLIVYIWGSIDDQISSIVDHEGNFVLPSIGAITVKDLTLREGKERIKNKILKVYKKVEMSIILSEIRQFKVYLLGEVVEPGYYVINGATRVSDLIIIAGGFSDTSNESLRNIKVSNERHTSKHVDLAQFYHSNIIDKNPYLLEGDRVFVGKRMEYLTVSGSVNFPGTYDFIPGDQLISVLNAAGGLIRGADSSKIIVTRFADNKDSLLTFEVSFSDSSIYSFPLEMDDRVLVCEIPDYRVHRQVTIEGEVKFPGVYPIRDEKTKLVDIIALAGGLTEKAFLRGSKIVRKTNNRFGDREFDRLKQIPVDNLQPLERSYLKTKLTEEEGIVSIDFEELLTNGSDHYNIILKDGDKITVAQKDLTVKVTGAVVSPGLVGFKEGAGYKYYIDQVGGFNTRGRKRSVMIIKGGTETWLKPRKVKKIEASDAVWVPEKEYRDRLQVTKDVLIILSSIAAIITSYYLISTK